MIRQRPTPLKSRPTISVVIPCYRYGQFLRQCVGSVVSQQGVQVDVLIVDDASSDGSAEVAREIAREHSNVRTLVHDVNKGHIATYNHGLSGVSGELVLLLSADDALAPGALARAAAIFAHHPQVGLVYGFAPPFDRHPPRARSFAVRWTVWNGKEWIAAVCRRGRNPVATASAVLRRDALTQAGGYDSRFPHAADFMLWLRVAASWGVAHVEGVDQAFYRQHQGNMHATRFAGVVPDVRERANVFSTFFAEHGEFPDRRRLQGQVSHALRKEVVRGLVAARQAHATPVTVELLEALKAELDVGTPGDVQGHFLVFENPLVRSLTTRVEWRMWRRFGMYP